MTKIIQNKSITTIFAITATIALLGLSSVFITNQEALAQIEPIVFCNLINFPADPLRVNIMTTARGFHTVIMEKEIFDCVIEDPEMGIIPGFLLQTTLLIQFDEFKGGKQAGIIKIEVIECQKDILFIHQGPVCKSLGTPPATIDPLDCSRDTGQTEAFVDMDSASYNWFQRFGQDKVTFKTVIVEKEILDCRIAGTTTPVIVDVFTIEEKFNGKVKFFKWVVCEKDELNGKILGCIASDTPVG